MLSGPSPSLLDTQDYYVCTGLRCDEVKSCQKHRVALRSFLPREEWTEASPSDEQAFGCFHKLKLRDGECTVSVGTAHSIFRGRSHANKETDLVNAAGSESVGNTYLRSVHAGGLIGSSPSCCISARLRHQIWWLVRPDLDTYIQGRIGNLGTLSIITGGTTHLHSA